MTQAKLVMDSGLIFYLGSDHGSYFDMEPLTAADVTLHTSQGFQQTGVTVASASVGGISRTISGCFCGTDARVLARRLLRTLVPPGSGTLYLGDTVCTEFYVEKSPELIYRSSGFIDFSFMLFSADPWWVDRERRRFSTAVTTALFAYPTTLNAHIFAESANGQITVKNPGDMPVKFQVTFTALKPAEQVALIQVATLEKLTVNHAVARGDVITVGWSGQQLQVRLNGTEDIFAALDEDADLFELAPGTVRLTTGSEGITAEVTFQPVYYCVPEVC